ncbi:hypothetical protein HW555_009473 [Spodoptera exigua]|uniref:Uncharacterized protein n=1 Tax=Spodoptera exigua TaxID=7107 RepID=A0A835G8W5_SPOEX|nr:hypothetical protein HW555_009473 [Spodoptera exigua]
MCRTPTGSNDGCAAAELRAIYLQNRLLIQDSGVSTDELKFMMNSRFELISGPTARRGSPSVRPVTLAVQDVSVTDAVQFLHLSLTTVQQLVATETLCSQ